MTFGLVADHGIGRVQHLVEEQARQPEHRIEKRRRDHAIGKILRQCLDRGTADTATIKRIRITTDDHRDRVPPAVEPVFPQPVGHRPDMIRKALLGEKHEDDDDLEGKADQPPGSEEAVKNQTAGHARKQQGQDRQQSIGAPVAPALSPAIEVAIEERDRLAEDNDGMWQPLPEPGRIANQPVEQQGNRQQHQ